jgi:tripartite-type tricarboxylate transporter receptor subunit TctC
VSETLPGYAVTSWLGLLAPAKTPPAIRTRLAAEYEKALKIPDVIERLRQAGMDINFVALDDFGALLKSDYDRMGAVVRSASIKAN